jgi:CRISPR-associated exonuclease Cas4
VITGTLVNYYHHCKRQCWLFYNRINLEDNSEDVRVGRILHEIKNEEAPEVIENIRIDKITGEYIIEIKKSDADLTAAKEQLIFYLYTLYKKGIKRKGRLECIEKNKQEKKIHIIDLGEQELEAKEKLYEEIENFLLNSPLPEAVLSKKCNRCAYYDYCFI